MLQNRCIYKCDKNCDGTDYFSYEEMFLSHSEALWIVPTREYSSIINILKNIGVKEDNIVHFDMPPRNKWCRDFIDIMWTKEEVQNILDIK